jgi:hypothetical protein
VFLLLMLALLEDLHLLLEVLLQTLVHLPTRDALNHCLAFLAELHRLLVYGLRDLADGLLVLGLSEFVDDHGLELVDFGEVGDEDLYELELELLLDDFVGDVGAGDEFDEELLE